MTHIDFVTIIRINREQNYLKFLIPRIPNQQSRLEVLVKACCLKTLTPETPTLSQTCEKALFKLICFTKNSVPQNLS